MPTTGACLCGGVRFRVEGELAPIQVCHCRQCQKAQGGPFVAVVPVARADVHWLSGEDLLAAYESSPGKERVFCRRCGSPVLSRRTALPEVVRLRAGLLEGPLGVRPARHAYTAERCNWWPLDDGLPQYPQAAPDAAR